MHKFLVLQRVQIGSVEHILPIVLVIIFAIGFYKFAKNKLPYIKQKQYIHYIGCFISAFVLVFHLIKIAKGGYDVTTDLPFYLCSFLALFLPVLTYSKSFLIFEIVVFWIITGTLQGVLTPDISEGFPSFDYFRYWVVHLGLLFVIGYFIYVLGMKPTLKSVFKSFFALQVFMIITMVFNYLVGGNYSYLNRKPDAASVLDALPDWPYYILVVELIVLPLFFMVYGGFLVFQKKKV